MLLTSNSDIIFVINSLQNAMPKFNTVNFDVKTYQKRFRIYFYDKTFDQHVF